VENEEEAALLAATLLDPTGAGALPSSALTQPVFAVRAAGHAT